MTSVVSGKAFKVDFRNGCFQRLLRGERTMQGKAGNGEAGEEAATVAQKGEDSSLDRSGCSGEGVTHEFGL